VGEAERRLAERYGTKDEALAALAAEAAQV
jgi:acetyl-CoA acetyltransferase